MTLTDYLAEDLPGVTLINNEPRRFEISDGTTVHGWVLRHPDTTGSGPLLLDIHGGPHMPGLVQRTQPIAYVADLGNVNVAPRTWDDIVSRIDPAVDLGRRIRERTGRNRARRAEGALTE